MPTSTVQGRWFADEVQPHDAHLKAYLRGTFPAVRDVEDVVQESYLRIWRSRTRQPIRCTRAFLFTIARNLALRVIRTQQPTAAAPSVIPPEPVDERADPAEATIEKEQVDLLADAVMELPPRCREIVVLHKINGLSQQEVAQKLGIAERTVERQVHIGVRRCAEFLKRRGMEHAFADGI